MFYELNGRFEFDKQAFENKIYQKEPSLVYMCNPNNPTGLMLSKEYIEFLLKEFPDTMFLIDEAYIEFSGGSCKELVKEYDNILISLYFKYQKSQEYYYVCTGVGYRSAWRY